jgi:hypothetical protein
MARYGQAAQSNRILAGYGGDLVAITAEVTLNPGDSIDLPADALRNGLGEPILLDGLSWVIDAQQAAESADPPTVTVGMPGGGVSLSLRFGDKPITAGEVPIYSLGCAKGQDVEHAILGVADDTDTMFLLGAYASGVWQFDHPMSLDAGDTISIHVTHLGLQNLPCVVSLALTGRTGKDLPRSRWLPYAAAWVPPAFDPTVPTAVAPTIATSTERDLVNRVPGKLQISRFIGRLARLGVVTTPIATDEAINEEQPFPRVQELVAGNPETVWFPSALESFLTITMRDSRANDNVPVAVPFRQVFEPESRAWECPHELEENGYYIAELTLAVPAITTDTSIQPVITMIGSWEGA